MKFNVEKYIQAYEDSVQTEHAAKEKEQQGNLRVGNSGCVTCTGKIIGSCPRVSMLRAIGIHKESGKVSSFFFNAGTNTEDELMRSLQAQHKGLIKKEVGDIKWTTDSGRLVTGRPDFIISNDFDTMGIELKTVCSLSTAEKVREKCTPDPKHLCQAGHYSWQLGYISYILLYWNHNVFSVFKKKIEPFRMYYDLYWIDKTLHYEVAGVGRIQKTLITSDGIQDYFNLVDECICERSLPPRVDNIYSDGTPIEYDQCKYCDFQTACELTNSFDTFVEEAGGKGERI